MFHLMSKMTRDVLACAKYIDEPVESIHLPNFYNIWLLKNRHPSPDKAARQLKERLSILRARNMSK